nr:phage/plasmid primase, P4 family [Candidatus Freyarchaeota archaeon]
MSEDHEVKVVKKHDGYYFVMGRRLTGPYKDPREPDVATVSGNLLLDDGNPVLVALENWDVLQKYFDGKKFIPRRLGDEIKEKYRFLTMCDNFDTYYYSNGIYVKNAEAIIKDYCARVLGEEYLIHYVNEVINYIKDSTILFFETRKEIKEPINLVPLKNGILNIDTYALLQYDPKYRFFSKLPLEFKPGAECPKFLKWLREVQPEENILLIQEIFGYLLYRTYDFQFFFIFVGKKWNGKTTLVKIMSRFLGEGNWVALSWGDLEFNRFAKAELFEKWANLDVELSGHLLKNADILKKLTGQDPIQGEVKYSRPFWFENYAKIIMATNKLPHLDDSVDYDEAFFRRVVLINFPFEFPPEKARPQEELLKELEPEFPGILNWALEGLKRLRKNRKPSYELDIDATMAKWHKLTSSIAYFAELLEYDPQAEPISNSFLWHLFLAFCENEKISTVTQGIFTKKLPLHVKGAISQPRKKGIGVGKKSTRCWIGVGFKVTVENKEEWATKTTLFYPLLKNIEGWVEWREGIDKRCRFCSAKEENEGLEGRESEPGLEKYQLSGLSKIEKSVFAFIQEGSVVTQGDIHRKLDLEYDEISAALAKLEKCGYIEIKTESGVLNYRLKKQQQQEEIPPDPEKKQQEEG